MREKKRAIWVAGFYFLYANTVFFLGSSGKIDGIIWGMLSFFAYWPFSTIPRYLWRNVFEKWNLYDMYLTPLKLYVPHCITYVFDVIFGTLWWWIIVYCLLLVLTRLRKRPARVT
jgi:hypothetical protein